MKGQWCIMKRKIVVGSLVRIKPESRYYGQGPNNPPDRVGAVIAFKGKLSIFDVKVRWSENSANSYRFHDLIDITTNLNAILWGIENEG